MTTDELREKSLVLAAKVGFTAGQVLMVALALICRAGMSNTFLVELENAARNAEFAEDL